MANMTSRFFPIDRFARAIPSERLVGLLWAGDTGDAAKSVPFSNRMYIGHINLAKSFNGAGEYFVKLIEALQEIGVQQHVLVRNVELAKRLDLVENVAVGPVVRSAITASCLMPVVDIVHIHDALDGQAGLLLTLTRSIPFVLTHDGGASANGPLAKSVYRRAAGFIYQGDADAARHLRIYRHAIDNWRTVASS